MSAKEKKFFYGKFLNLDKPILNKKDLIGYYKTCCGYSVSKRRKTFTEKKSSGTFSMLGR